MPGQGRFGLFNDAESRALDLMLHDKKSASEVADTLRSEGLEFTPEQLRQLKAAGFEKLKVDETVERKADFLLESVDRTILEWEELYARFKKICDKFESEHKSYEELIAAKEMKSMLSTGLRKLGLIQESLQQIKIKNLNVLTNTDVLIAVKQNQLNWFEKMKPEFTDGKLIFNEPVPEVIDAYQKWRFKKRRISIPES